MSNQCINKGLDTKKLPSLYDVFRLGDRVKRKCKYHDGKQGEYTGIVLAISKDSIEVYWDTRDGKYRLKDMDIAFTLCSADDIFKGDECYSPISKEKSSL